MHALGSSGLALGTFGSVTGCGDDGSAVDPAGSSTSGGSTGPGGDSTGIDDGSTGIEGTTSGLDSSSGDDASTGEPTECQADWWLCGNFGPVEEFEAFDLEVQGTLPAALDGLYLRNGPNPMLGETVHWFLGDGMVHGVRLQGGNADWYRARYVQTAILGVPPEPGMLPDLSAHTANTSVAHHAGRVMCLAESGIPYEITTELETVGTHDFAGVLDGAMTAHPKIDPVTGEMLFFGYDVLTSSATYRQVDPTGALVRSETIDLPAPVMMHDFQVTPSHVVFMDMPVVFDFELAIAGDVMPFRWDPSNGARIGVMPRSGSATDVVWFDVDLGYVFHTLNAYEDPRNPDRIVLDVVWYPEIWVTGPTETGSQGTLTRFVLDLGTGMATQEALDDRDIDFPVLDPRRQGLPHRYGYALSTDGMGLPFRTVIKYDLQRGTRTEKTLEGLHLDEVRFVPGGPGEDEGWLLGYAFDPRTERSQLLVLDASDLAADPVARVMLPRRVPHGFHGLWVPTVTR